MSERFANADLNIGKFFVLSLMISLVGRGYIRQKLNDLSQHVDPFNDMTLPNTIGVDGPMFVPGVTIKVETTRTFASTQISTVPHRVSLTNQGQGEGDRGEFTFTMSGLGSDINIALPACDIEDKKST
ncbi:hypothetical protein FRC09_013838 [Ceratobasidium sp. 395]|nr:hypothetical protein FRC09_013838 [Ceratobasidium sp. 395]